MTKKNLKITLAIALVAAPVVAHAQSVRPAYQYPGTPPTTGAASVQLGDSPVFFTPYVAVAAGRDDNVLLTSDNELSSALYIFSPGVKLDARSSNAVMQFAYQGQFGRYASSRQDDYQDHITRTQLDVAFNARNFLRLSLDYWRAHDPRGSTDRAVSGSPDVYRYRNPGFVYSFGAPGAQGRLEIYGSDMHKTYTNNRDVTRFSDRNTTEYGGAFYWRVMPRTYVLAEARETMISYDVPSPSNGTETRVFAGVSWEATAATTGTLKVGRMRREFDSPAIPSETSTSWEGIITWAPRTYSTFDFYTTRGTNESTGLGNYIISDIAGVTWTHAWSSVVSTGVLLRYQRDDYQGFDRTDKTKSLGVRVGYKFRRWLTLGAEYNFSTRDSNVPGIEYDKNLYLFTATASM